MTYRTGYTCNMKLNLREAREAGLFVVGWRETLALKRSRRQTRLLKSVDDEGKRERGMGGTACGTRLEYASGREKTFEEV